MKAILILHQPEFLYEKSLEAQNLANTPAENVAQTLGQNGQAYSLREEQASEGIVVAQEPMINNYVQSYYSLRDKALQKLQQMHPQIPIYSQSYMDGQPEKENSPQAAKVAPAPVALAKGQSEIERVIFLGRRRETVSATDFFSRVLARHPADSKTSQPPQPQHPPQPQPQTQKNRFNPDCFYVFYGWYPFLDTKLCQEIQETHERFGAHLTYGENIPDGFVPDLLDREFLQALVQHKVTDIRSFAFANLDQFDVEIFYKRPDLRHYRLNLTTQTHRSCQTVEKIAALSFPLEYENLETLLSKHPLVLRHSPAFFNIELTNKTQLAPFYWPQLNRPQTELAPQILDKLLADMQQHAMVQDVTICLGGLGEPTEHEFWLEYLQAFLRLPQVKRIYLVTFAYQLNRDALQRMNGLQGSQKIEIIIALSTLDRARYQKFYSHDLFDTVMQNLKDCHDFLKNKTPKTRIQQIFVEMVCMQENESEIDAFMKFFQFDLLMEDYHLREDWFSEISNEVRTREKNGLLQPILAKPNDFLGSLKDRKISDLSPLVRSFCWHLQRDFVITCEGKVPLCQQDPGASLALTGDLQKQDVLSIFRKQEKSYLIDQQRQFRKNIIACNKCDEWHVFHA